MKEKMKEKKVSKAARKNLFKKKKISVYVENLFQEVNGYNVVTKINVEARVGIILNV